MNPLVVVGAIQNAEAAINLLMNLGINIQKFMAMRELNESGGLTPAQRKALADARNAAVDAL